MAGTRLNGISASTEVRNRVPGTRRSIRSGQLVKADRMQAELRKKDLALSATLSKCEINVLTESLPKGWHFSLVWRHDDANAKPNLGNHIARRRAHSGPRGGGSAELGGTYGTTTVLTR